MKTKLKIISIMFVAIVTLVTLTGCSNTKDSDKLTIISTSFPGYDFARAVVLDNEKVDVEMLLKPGEESHTYKPTSQDIRNIKNSDIFIYVGKNSDEWVEDVLKDIDAKKTKIIKLVDLVDTKEESANDMEEYLDDEVKIDEHVWTSPVNAISIISRLKDEIVKKDKEDEEIFNNNAIKYILQLSIIDTEIRDLVASADRKEIIFGDRFPLRYFTDEYGLSYYAAFIGCSEKTEASAKTISFLIDKVKNDNIPVVFHTELSKSKIANTISEKTKAKVLEFNSAHNISQKDFDAGLTYVDIMKKNIEVLKEALN